MSKRKVARKSTVAVDSAPGRANLHVPLPAVLIGLGLLAAPAASYAGTAITDFYTIASGSTLSGVNVTSNDTITGNSTVQVVEVGAPSHGVASLQSNGALTYTPDPGFLGTDSFAYELINEDTTYAQVVITVNQALPVPGLVAPGALALLSAGIAGLALRRRRKN